MTSCHQEEEGAGGEGAEEETSTQRSRRKKRELAAFESRGAKLKPLAPEAPPEDEDGDEAGAGGGAAKPPAAGPPADAPTWPEVAKALESGPKELILERPAGGLPDASALIDPALWRCASVNLLKLSLRGADAAAPRPLRALPDDVRFLSGLRTLIISNNALEALPDAIGTLTARAPCPHRTHATPTRTRTGAEYTPPSLRWRRAGAEGVRGRVQRADGAPGVLLQAGGAGDAAAGAQRADQRGAARAADKPGVRDAGQQLAGQPG